MIIIDHANIHMEVMHERSAHNFPLNLVVVKTPSTDV